MAAWQINEAEDGALQGLSLLAQVLYMRGLRPRMDYGTGLVGDCRARGVTRDALASVCEYLPDAGSTRRATKPSAEQVRAALAELGRAGLVVRPTDRGPRRLVFRLILATVNHSASARNPRGTPEEPPSSSHRPEPQRGAVSGQGTTEEQPSDLEFSTGGATSLQGQVLDKTYLLTSSSSDTSVVTRANGEAEAGIATGGELDWLTAEQIAWLQAHEGAVAQWGQYLDHIGKGRRHRVPMARRRALLVELRRLCDEQGCTPGWLLGEQVRRGWMRLCVPEDQMQRRFGNGQDGIYRGALSAGDQVRAAIRERDRQLLDS